MTRDEIRTRVGPERYDAMCRGLLGNTEEDYDPELPHEICDHIWDSPDTYDQKIRLLRDIYEEMPCYGHLMYVTHYYGDFSPSEKSTLWSWYRSCLEQGDRRLAEPFY